MAEEDIRNKLLGLLEFLRIKNYLFLGCHIQKKKKISEAQKELILGGARLIESKEYCEELTGKIQTGSMTTDIHFVLSELYNKLIKEEELEASTESL